MWRWRFVVVVAAAGAILATLIVVAVIVAGGAENTEAIPIVALKSTSRDNCLPYWISCRAYPAILTESENGH